MDTTSTTTAWWRRAAKRDGSALVVFGSLAFVVRLVPVLTGGGLAFYGRYDDGVYYTAAMALSFGRVPYRQFLLLHPPAIMLVLLPFAALGRATTDITGMEAARVAFMAIGAVNTILVAAIARRWGRPAMLVAGLLYACWDPAIYAEQSTFLEPVGGLLVLLALWLMLRTDRLPTMRAEWLAGGCLGLAESVKIWYVAAWAVFVVWQLLERRSWSALRLVVGGAVALGTVVAPFAIASHGQLFNDVIRDQLRRPPMSTGRLLRIADMLGIRTFTHGHGQLRHVFAALVLAVLVGLIVVCVRNRAARPVVGLLVVNSIVLFVSPTYYHHYASLIAAPAALVVGIGLTRSYANPRVRRYAPGLVAVGCALALTSGVASAATPTGSTFPGTFERAAPPGCIAADDPLALAEMNRLSADFRNGCRVLVDVTGSTYAGLRRVGQDGKVLARADNIAWQQYLYTYLTSARAFVILRPRNDGLTPADLQRYRSFQVVSRGEGLSLQAGHPAE